MAAAREQVHHIPLKTSSRAETHRRRIDRGTHGRRATPVGRRVAIPTIPSLLHSHPSARAMPPLHGNNARDAWRHQPRPGDEARFCHKTHRKSCLLYTSDAADERSSVDLGGRRIIKKKK